MQETRDDDYELVDTYEGEKYTMIIKHNPKGKNFSDAINDYFRTFLNKELNN